ncbi:protein SOB FIVE-LIKE 5-like [Cornus florida]|uniref:protein SOB FIVE-LIKE 5-like n=1 Tax=Cornus florida TaxID=4283 RepID=UPI0028A06B44|nr:protein SOB FIVE-LIKE 5-like [Cornus florida]
MCVYFVSIYSTPLLIIKKKNPLFFFPISLTMNGTVLDSECNSGCESGWTLYLEHSFLSSHKANNGSYVNHEEKKAAKDEEDEEEDLSMVSDASSGPPHFHEEGDYGSYYNGCFNYNAPIDHVTLPKNSGRIRQKIVKEDRRRKAHDQEQPSFLDDTASSPIFNLSNNNFTLNNNQAPMENILEFSQGHSATHFEGRSAFQGHFGFFQSGNQQQQNQWFEGKRWG